MEKETNAPSINIFELLLVLSRGKFKIVSITIIFAVLSVWYSLTIKPIFECSTKIIYESTLNNGLSGELGTLAAIAGVGTSNNVSISDYLEDIIHSSSFLSPILDRQWQINENDSTRKSLSDLWEIEVDSNQTNKTRVHKQMSMRELRSKISYFVDKKNGLISINTEAQTPYLTFQLNNYVVDNLNQFVLTKLKVKSLQNRDFIQERLKETKMTLDSVEMVFKEFNRLYFISNSPEIVLRKMRIERELGVQEKIYLQLRQQFEMAKIEEQKDIPVISVLEAAEIPYKKSKPNKKVIVLAGFVFGFFFSVCFVFILDFIQKNKEMIKILLKG